MRLVSHGHARAGAPTTARPVHFGMPLRQSRADRTKDGSGEFIQGGGHWCDTPSCARRTTPWPLSHRFDPLSRGLAGWATRPRLRLRGKVGGLVSWCNSSSGDSLGRSRVAASMIRVVRYAVRLVRHRRATLGRSPGYASRPVGLVFTSLHIAPGQRRKKKKQTAHGVPPRRGRVGPGVGWRRAIGAGPTDQQATRPAAASSAVQILRAGRRRDGERPPSSVHIAAQSMRFRTSCGRMDCQECDPPCWGMSPRRMRRIEWPARAKHGKQLRRSAMVPKGLDRQTSPVGHAKAQSPRCTGGVVGGSRFWSGGASRAIRRPGPLRAPRAVVVPPGRALSGSGGRQLLPRGLERPPRLFTYFLSFSSSNTLRFFSRPNGTNVGFLLCLAGYLRAHPQDWC